MPLHLPIETTNGSLGMLVEGEDDMSAGSLSSTNWSSTGVELEKHSMDVEKTAKRTTIVALCVVLIGGVVSAGFLYSGIRNATQSNDAAFERRSLDLTKEIVGSLSDYEMAASWIHEASRDWRSGFTREQFRTVYDYISDGGLQFFAMEWCPNVTKAERPFIEEEAREYFENVTAVNYTGITGLLPEDPASMEIVPRIEQPFYFPIQYFEPADKMAGLYHYDVYSAPWEQPSIRLALETGMPVVTEPFEIVASGVQDSNTVVLYHPGVRLPGTKTRDLSNILIRIEALLTRAARFQTESHSVYLYDATDSEKVLFLGGMDIQVLDQEGDEKELTYHHSVVPLEDLAGSKSHFYEEDIVFAARTWTIAVVPIDDSYQPNLTFVILSGSLIFVASLCLSLWMIASMRRAVQMHRVVTNAAAEAAIVSNLFPVNVRERMIKDHLEEKKRTGASKKQDVFSNNKSGRNDLCEDKLNDFLTSEGIFGSKPIADLHPYTTIMFADLVGFTAWSSVRQPSEVFTLLETLYHAFDTIAKRRRVFKVETIGDCYVAVAGLPEPRDDHAIVMARFASDCLERTHKLTKALEKTLGPDTGDLGLRIGLHSGQVTAGVLRGDKGRFQLFGDTMNMASRMESTGSRNKIQVSQETADLLNKAGRQKWLTPRGDIVHVKGKGAIATYFLRVLRADSTTSVESSSLSEMVSKSKTGRLVDWNAQVLSGLLKKILARRKALGKSSSQTIVAGGASSSNGMVLDEVQAIIEFPEFDGKVIRSQVDLETVKLDSNVVSQLHMLITEVASMYRKNPFHSFEHASHVTMSVVKMMTRIVDPKEFAAKEVVATKKKGKGQSSNQQQREQRMHDLSFGINSDPLAQFACAFSALIHDLDHQGVPNSTLVNEQGPLALRYGNKSVAEQNSVDLAWGLLMKPNYDQLRSCICCDKEEFDRFRSLVVNSVMATDIMDKNLGSLRKARWNKAFFDAGGVEPSQQQVSRKATIVIEHLIQASDISHTMQHWNIYIKWNELLFMEMYKAFKAGRLEKDPSIGWYSGEMGFFDFYIIPLAKKLFTCGVFGVSSDEFLNYALINRKEWEQKGEQIVEQYLKNYAATDANDRDDELEQVMDGTWEESIDQIFVEC